MRAPSSSCTIGLVTAREPMWNSATSEKSKLLGPGATNSPPDSAIVMPNIESVSSALLLWCGACLVETCVGHVDPEAGTDEDADRHEERRSEPSIEGPAGQSVDRDTADDVAEGVPGVALGGSSDEAVGGSCRAIAPRTLAAESVIAHPRGPSLALRAVVDRDPLAGGGDQLARQPGEGHDDDGGREPAARERLGAHVGTVDRGHDDGAGPGAAACRSSGPRASRRRAAGARRNRPRRARGRRRRASALPRRRRRRLPDGRRRCRRRRAGRRPRRSRRPAHRGPATTPCGGLSSTRSSWRRPVSQWSG